MAVNNTFYSALGERWYTAQDDPIALLRAESRLRNPWVLQTIQSRFSEAVSVLDMGCGGGLLSNALAVAGHRVTAVDAAEGALEIAQAHDATRSVNYRSADVRHLPFDDASFDVVCAMDVLEHVEPWPAALCEAARVLRPGGIFLFYTFNRTFLSWLLAVKGIEWFVKNSPTNMHTYSGFIRPAELSRVAQENRLSIQEWMGMRPCLTRAFFQMLLTGNVPEDFSFRFTRGTHLGYLGTALKI